MTPTESTRDLISEHKVLTGFNRFIYFALAAIVINIANSLYGPYKDYIAIYILSITAVILIVSLILNKKNYPLAAKTITALTFNMVFFLITMHIGLKGGAYLYYFPFMLAYIYLFRTTGNKKYVQAFSIVSLSFLAVSLIVAPNDPPVFKVPEYKMKQIFFITFFVSFSLTVYFFVLIYSYQEKLNSRILNLEKIAKRQQLRSIIETQETSIQNIVHELQNNVNQTLTASKFFLEEASEGGDNRMLVSKSHGLTNDAINALTMLCISMHPTVVTDVGLIDGIRQYIVELKKISTVQIQFECNDPSIEKVDQKDKISIFRIIQNYLSLVIQNPDTSTVNIEVSYKAALLTLVLSQNDPNFNFMKTGQPFNLNNINNRVTYLNGTIRQKKEGKFEISILEISLS
jgi:glucose-6-phosphate-specific signal transduction histidine kinase